MTDGQTDRQTEGQGGQTDRKKHGVTKREEAKFHVEFFLRVFQFSSHLGIPREKKSPFYSPLPFI